MGEVVNWKKICFAYMSHIWTNHLHATYMSLLYMSHIGNGKMYGMCHISMPQLAQGTTYMRHICHLYVAYPFMCMPHIFILHICHILYINPQFTCNIYVFNMYVAYKKRQKVWYVAYKSALQRNIGNHIYAAHMSFICCIPFLHICPHIQVS